MVELRSYQRDLLGRIEEALAASKSRMMLQLPTGGGKTHIAGELLSRWLKDGRKAVWLTHRKELATQEELKELAMLADDDELSPHRDPFLKNFLEEERRRVGGADEKRKEELRFYIGERESDLANDSENDKLFENYLAILPLSERPQTGPQKYRLYNEWEAGLKQELTRWRDELAALGSQTVDGQLVFNNARERLLRLFEAEAREAGLLPQRHIRETPLQTPVEEHASTDSLDSGEWMTFVELGEWIKEELTSGFSVKPECIRPPRGKEISVETWADLLFQTAEWLIEEGLLTKDVKEFKVGGMTKRYLIHQTPNHPKTPNHPSGREFEYHVQLSNGLYIERKWDSKNMVKRCVELVAKFGQDPSQFHVRLRE